MFVMRGMRWLLPFAGIALLALAACEPAKKATTRQVLDRIGYGPDAWSLARVAELGSIEAYIEEQLNPQLLDDSALEAEIASRYPVQTMSYGVSRISFDEYGSDPEVGPFAPLRDATRAKILRSVFSKRQLQQVLVDFWYNHFNVDAVFEEARWGFLTLERDAIRPNVLGKFEDMLLATAKNPGMLDYLDNYLNFKEGFVSTYLVFNANNQSSYGVNENYAREILELHTLGVDGGYTHADLREVARAFTGWTLAAAYWSSASNGFKFLSAGHDTGEKQIMGALTLPAGRGQVDGTDVIHFLATHPKTAERISRKLCQRFVSETPPETLVQAAKQTFLDTGGDLREVMRTILLSPGFLSARYMRTKVKRPLVVVASLARAVGVSDHALFAEHMDSRLQMMGEGLYRAGPPTGYPESSRSWSGEGPFLQRINLANQAANGNSGFSPAFAVTGTTPDEIVEQLRAQYLGAGMEASTRSALVEFAQGLPASARIRETAALLLASPDFLVH
jgi:uncharacterized protein (DUF1800 family)